MPSTIVSRPHNSNWLLQFFGNQDDSERDRRRKSWKEKDCSDCLGIGYLKKHDNNKGIDFELKRSFYLEHRLIELARISLSSRDRLRATRILDSRVKTLKSGTEIFTVIWETVGKFVFRLQIEKDAL